MNVSNLMSLEPIHITENIQVDHIVFLTADVTVKPNLNEVRDYRYVSIDELRAMFEDPGEV